MSFKTHIPLLENKHLPKMSPNERLILAHLCVVARDGDSFTWMSPKKLQRRTGIPYRTHMNKCIRDMIKKGVLSRAFGTDDKGKSVYGLVVKLDQFDGHLTSNPETNKVYPLDGKGPPTETKDVQHIKALRKHKKVIEVAEGEKPEWEQKGLYKEKENFIKKDFVKEFEKKDKIFKKFVNDFITKNLEDEVDKVIFQKKKEMPNPYMNLSAKQISKLQIKTEPPVKKIHAGTLCTIWQMCHAEFYPDIFIGSPTLAERGMFKQYLKFATPKHAVAALYFAIKYWIAFVKFCNKNGAVGKPTQPRIKYLLKYVKQSVTFYTSKQNSVTGVYSNLVQQQNLEGLGLFDPLSEKKVPEVKGGKESGSESVSDVPMNLEDAGDLYKKLFQKGKK